MRDSTARETSWPQHRLTDLAHYHNGVAFKPADWSMDGLPIIRIEQLNNPEGEFDRYTGPVAEANHIRDGDLVFSWSATLKVVIWRHGDGVLNQHLFKVVPKPGFDARFIYFLLDQSMEALGNGSHGSTMKHIKRSELDKFTARVPALAKQQKIAAILTSLDTAIERTEALIEKRQQIKAGLMHDLFTRGVLPNGQLRPSQEQAPELYRETAIGRIPVEWSLAALRTIVGSAGCVNGPFGSDLLTAELRAEGVPVLYVQDVKPGHFKRVSAAHVTESKARQLAFCNVRQGDILVAKVGAPPCDSCVYPASERAIVTQDVIRIRPTPESDPTYLSSLFNAPFGRRVVKKISIEGTRERVSLTEFKGLVLPMPRPDEQREIGRRLRAAQALIFAEERTRDKLMQRKRGLMQDLLTGKVTVKVAEAEAEPA